MTRAPRARWLAVLGLLVCGSGLMMLSRINVDITTGELVVGMVVLAAGVGLAMMPIMSNALAAVPAESAESASSLNTLTQRVSQSLGLGIVNAFLISAGESAAFRLGVSARDGRREGRRGRPAGSPGPGGRR